MTRPVRPAVRLFGDVLESRDVPAGYWADYPVVPTIDGAMKANLRDVAGRGVVAGNRADAFTKFGDSITGYASGSFFALGQPGYNPSASGLAGYPDLLDDWAAYRAPVAGGNSFSRLSTGAFPGWTSSNVVGTVPGELAAVRPAISLIMIGTNDAIHQNVPLYRENLRQIVRLHLDRGVIPVLSTIPPNTTGTGGLQAWVNTANTVVVEVAEEFNIPVWNYWRAISGLPLQGVGDGVHPSVSPAGAGFFGPGGLLFGYNARNLTALQVLDKLRDVVFADDPPDGFVVPETLLWTPLAPGQRVVAVGGGFGGPPVVQVRDADTGRVLNQFLAFDPAFGGGVRVVTGDVNGDGVTDVVVGAGPGGGPVVRGYSGIDGSELFSFFAYEPTFTGGVTVAVGDLNGDGRPEVVIGSGVGGGPRVRVLDPRTGDVLRDFLAFEESFRGGVNVAVGDFGPGVGPAIAATPGAGGGGVVALFDPLGNRLTTFEVFAGDFRGGAELAAGDLDGDGFADLAVCTGAGAERVKVLKADGTEEADIAVGGGTRGVRVAVAGGMVVANYRGDPAGLFGVFNLAGDRLRTLVDPSDGYFALGAYIG